MDDTNEFFEIHEESTNNQYADDGNKIDCISVISCHQPNIQEA